MNKTEINFFAGFDPVCPVPKVVEAAGLKYRLAVVQETFRPDSVDMYFDKALWQRLLEFAATFGPALCVRVIDRPWDGTRHGEPKEADELPLEVFRTARRASTADDQDPAEYVMVRDGDNLVLCIATEFWTQVGGPRPYSDSYTYSIFSKEELAPRVRHFLAAATESSGWRLAEEVHPAPQLMRRA